MWRDFLYFPKQQKLGLLILSILIIALLVANVLIDNVRPLPIRKIMKMTLKHNINSLWPHWWKKRT